MAAAPSALPVPVAVGLRLDRAGPSARRSGVPSHERVGFHSVRSARADADRRSLGRRWTRRPDPGGRVQRAGLPDPLPGRFRDSGGGLDTARSAGCAAGEDEAHRCLYADCRGAGGSVDTADLSGCRINDRRKRQGFLLISLPRGRGFAHRCRGRVARRVDRAGPVGARDGRLPCVLPSLGSEKGRSCCFGCCLGSVARIRRFRARLHDAARRHAAVGRRLGWIAVEIPHSIVCSAPVRGAADDGRRPAVCAEAGAAGNRSGTAGSSSDRGEEDSCSRPDVGAVPASGRAGGAARTRDTALECRCTTPRVCRKQCHARHESVCLRSGTPLRTTVRAGASAVRIVERTWRRGACPLFQ